VIRRIPEPYPACTNVGIFDTLSYVTPKSFAMLVDLIGTAVSRLLDKHRLNVVQVHYRHGLSVRSRLQILPLTAAPAKTRFILHVNPKCSSGGTFGSCRLLFGIGRNPKSFLRIARPGCDLISAASLIVSRAIRWPSSSSSEPSGGVYLSPTVFSTDKDMIVGIED
jgi:hypothetical protein